MLTGFPAIGEARQPVGTNSIDDSSLRKQRCCADVPSRSCPAGASHGGLMNSGIDYEYCD